MAYGTVPPETDTLQLSEGDTITIKRRLNTGEVREVLKRSRAAGSVDGLEYGFHLTIAHLVEWQSPSGRWPPLAGVDESLRIAMLNALDPDDYTKIKDAITAHVARLAAEREDAKKKTDGMPTSALTSPLPSDAGGVLTGFALSTLMSTPR